MKQTACGMKQTKHTEFRTIVLGWDRMSYCRLEGEAFIVFANVPITAAKMLQMPWTKNVRKEGSEI